MADHDEYRITHPAEIGVLQDTTFVASIDFGTTYSGYAFQTEGKFNKTPLLIDAHKWGGQRSMKTPSTILFDENQQFYAFGEEAENKFNDLSEEDEHHNWYFFRRFKMLLYNTQGLNQNSTILDSNRGASMSAMEVFSAALWFLKDHLQKRLSTDIDRECIRWVITVPAIWDDAAKQFMRLASVKAGIKSDRLTLSLEPEAASLFCRYIPVNKQTESGEPEIACFGEGDRYMILDVGGGTVDITVHEVHSESGVGIHLRELYKANGGDWGGTKVDDAFEHLLNEVLTPAVMKQFAYKNRADLMGLIGSFEIKKRGIEPGPSKTDYITLPNSLVEIFRGVVGVTPDSYTNLPATYVGKIKFDGHKMRMDPDILKGLFKETCEQICKFAQDYFSKILRDQDEVAYILMVGGFSESSMLQAAVKTAFPTKRLIIPEDAGLAVLKGAVLYGHDPSMIRARVCKYTYGIAVLKQFEPALDKHERMVIKRGKHLCKDAFSIHAMIGQRFELNEAVGETTYVLSEHDADELSIGVYTSESKEPRYVDEPGCTKIGDIAVPLERQRREEQSPVKVQFVFGDTELKVKVTETNSGKSVTARFDFLNRTEEEQRTSAREIIMNVCSLVYRSKFTCTRNVA